MKLFRFIILGLVFVTGITQVFAQIGMGLGPAVTRDHGVTRGAFDYQVDPGETITDELIIVNSSDQDNLVQLTPLDATITTDGYFVLKNIGDARNNVGAWVKIDQPILLVPKKESVTTKFTMNVPENTSPGDYGGGILMSMYDGPDKEKYFKKYGIDDSKNTLSGSGAVIMVTTGTRIYLTVNGEQKFEFEWLNYEHVKNSEGKPIFQFEFKNSGNVTVEASGELKLKNIFGKEKLKDINLGTLLPGALIKPTIQWGNPPYIGLVKATSSISYKRAVSFGGKNKEVEIQNDPIVKELLIWFIPIRDILISIGVAFVTYIFLYLKRRRQKELLKKFQKMNILKEESVTSIANKYNIDWKFLAKINNIKAPYMVSSGQTILVPPNNSLVTVSPPLCSSPLFPDLGTPNTEDKNLNTTSPISNSLNNTSTHVDQGGQTQNSPQE